MENVFASYDVVMPSVYQEKIKAFVSTGSTNQSRENSPFDRQVDFWYMAVCIAFHKGLDPIKEKDTYKATSAEILSRNSYRVPQMQMIALSISEDIEVLNDPKKMFDICVGLANAGVPVLLNILSDPDSSPLWNIFTELEELTE